MCGVVSVCACVHELMCFLMVQRTELSYLAIFSYLAILFKITSQFEQLNVTFHKLLNSALLLLF